MSILWSEGRYHSRRKQLPLCYFALLQEDGWPQFLADRSIVQDAGVADDNVRIVKETVETLGGLDIIVANAGWTRFSTFSDLNDLSHDEWNKCWATNTMAHLQLMQQAGPIFNKNADGGVYLITSSVAVRITERSCKPFVEVGCRVSRLEAVVWLML